jgi:hypothetical protein
MLVTNLLNWHFHGVFGIVEAEWRVPNHVASFSDVIENVGRVVRFWQDVLLIYGMGNHAVGYVILVVPLLFALAILRRDRLLALYALTPVAFGMGLLMVYVLKTGIYVPVRATVFFWIVSCFLLVYGVEVLATSPARKIALLAAVLALAGFFAREFVVRFGYLQVWQASTRDLAADIPEGAERIVVFGYLSMLPGARNAAIQSFDGLAYRLRYLTGKPTVLCKQLDADCSNETPPFDVRSRFGSTLVETVDGVTFIRLPALDIAP